MAIQTVRIHKHRTNRNPVSHTEQKNTSMKLCVVLPALRAHNALQHFSIVNKGIVTEKERICVVIDLAVYEIVAGPLHLNFPRLSEIQYATGPVPQVPVNEGNAYREDKTSPLILDASAVSFLRRVLGKMRRGFQLVLDYCCS